VWAFIDFLLYETGTLGRRHVRDKLPLPRPVCAACRLEGTVDGWGHLWGAEQREGLPSPGCVELRDWARRQGLWDGNGIFAVKMFNPSTADDIKHLARMVSAITRMYRWVRYGSAQPRPDGAGSYFHFSYPGFVQAWREEAAPSK
jgi:hypothetical protein